jgi:hypothetical protein
MKKITKMRPRKYLGLLSLSLSLSLCCLCNDVLADASAWQRDCSWFRYRYNVSANIEYKTCDFVTNQLGWANWFQASDRACSFRVAVSGSAFFPFMTLTQCGDGVYYNQSASAFAECGPSGCTETSSATAAFAAGKRFASSLYVPNSVARLPILGKMGDRSVSSCRMSHKLAVISGNTITLKEVKAALRYDRGFGTESLAQVVVWYADSPEDSVITEKKILWEGKVSASNGSLKSFGGFEAKNVKMKHQTADSVVMEYYLPEHTITLPANIDMRRVTVTYRSDSRGGLDAKTQLDGLGADYTLYPNPLADQININLAKPLAEDVEGRLFYGPNQSMSKAFKLEKGKTNYQIDATDIPTGLLIIELRSKDAVLNRKRILKLK